MATTISNINTAQVDEAVAEGLRHALPALSAFSMSVNDADSIVNNVIRVQLATDPTVGNKTAGTMTSGSGTLTGVDVTLSRWRSAGFNANEGEVSARTFPAFWQDKIRGGVYALVKDVVDYSMSLITAANYGDTASDKLIVAPADFGQQDAAELWGLATTKIKGQEKTAFFNTAYAVQLFGQGSMAAVYASAGNNFLESGKLPRFLSMNQAHYADLPTNSQNLGGFVVGKAAIAVGIGRTGQLIASGEGNVVERRFITDPETGITVQYTVTVEGGGSINGELALLYGAAKGQDAIVRLKSA